jgi:hypothetical protein
MILIAVIRVIDHVRRHKHTPHQPAWRSAGDVMIPLAIITVVVLLLGARIAAPMLRRRRMAAELRGDWWSRFEKQFNDHVAGSVNATRDVDR